MILDSPICDVFESLRKAKYGLQRAETEWEAACSKYDLYPRHLFISCRNVSMERHDLCKCSRQNTADITFEDFLTSCLGQVELWSQGTLPRTFNKQIVPTSYQRTHDHSETFSRPLDTSAFIVSSLWWQSTHQVAGETSHSPAGV